MWVYILGIIAILLFFALLGAAAYFFKFSMIRADQSQTEKDYQRSGSTWHPFAERMEEAQQWMRDNTAEHISITSFDGLRLSALYMPCECENPKGTLIVFHGYRSLATVDFALEVKFMHELGYRLIVPYQRSHGESEGKYITYGVNERYDCRDWARYAENRFADDIFLAGISMGSATVMMAADLDLPSTVRGIVADCGFTSPWEIMKFVAWRDYKLPAFPILNLVDLYARIFAKVSLKGADSRKSLANTSLPVLFIHGEQDDFVPLEMTKKNFAACRSEKEIYLVKNAVHAQSYAADTQGCEEKIAAFLAGHGKNRGEI